MKKLLGPALIALLAASALNSAVMLIPVSGGVSALIGGVSFLMLAPYIILVMNGDTLTALASLGIFAAAATYFFGNSFAFNVLVFYLACGIIFYLTIRKVSSPVNRVVYSATGWVIAALIFNYIWKVNSGLSLAHYITDLSREFAAMSIGAYYDHRIPSAVIESIEGRMIENINIFRDYFSAWVIISAGAGGWMLYRFLSRRTDIEKLPSIAESRIPEGFIWLLLGAAGIFILRERIGESGLIALLGVNTLIILAGAYFFSGLGVVYSWLIKMKFSEKLSWFLILASVILMRAFYLVVLAGIIDVWVDFRKLKTEV